LRIEVPPTIFQTETLTLIFTSDLDLKTHESYGYDPYTSKKAKVKGHSVQKLRVDTDRDGGDYIGCGANAVDKNAKWQYLGDKPDS